MRKCTHFPDGHLMVCDKLFSWMNQSYSRPALVEKLVDNCPYCGVSLVQKSMSQIWQEKAEALKQAQKIKFMKTGKFDSHRVEQYLHMLRASKECSRANM